MSSLLKTEWLKIKKYRAFWWMTGLVALTYPGINYLFYKEVYREQLSDQRMGPILQMMPNPFTFPDVWQTVAYISSWFLFIPAVVVIMFITNEYTYKTHRQNIIDGWSRKQFMISKAIDVLVITLLITVLYYFTALWIGFDASKADTGKLWRGTEYIALFFLQTFSQLSIAFLIAFVSRKAFLALGIFMFYFVLLENLMVGLGKEYANDAGKYLPLEISDRLIPRPRFISGNEVEWKKLVAEANEHILYTILLVGLTWALCFWINSKRDL